MMKSTNPAVQAVNTMASDDPALERLDKATCVAVLKAAGQPASMRTSVGDLRDAVIALRVDTEANLVERAAEHQANAELDLHPAGPERTAAAKAEHKILKAWISDGEKPPRPATPNLDAMNEDYAAGKTATARRKLRAPATGARVTNERFRESRRIAAAGPRGKGEAIDDAAAIAWIQAEVTADPALTRNQAKSISYWVERHAVADVRFNVLWDAATQPAARSTRKAA